MYPKEQNKTPLSVLMRAGQVHLPEPGVRDQSGRVFGWVRRDSVTVPERMGLML